MKTYTNLLSQTQQTARIPGVRNMTPNRAGGWGFEVGDRELFERFILLGTTEGSYYATGRELTMQAALCIDRLLESGDGAWLVDKIVEVSTQGRAPKQEPGILALAVALKMAPDIETRRRASAAAAQVCRTVATAASLAEALRGLCPPPAAEGRDRVKPSIKGPAQRKAIAGCFERWARDPDRLAYQLVKYRQRGSWRARDLAKLSHYTSADPRVNDILSWLYGNPVENLHPQIAAYEEVKRLANAGGAGAPARIAELIRRYRLPWEAIPTEYAGLPQIRLALFERMPLTATVSQLGRLTAEGIFENPELRQQAAARLTSPERVRAARIHPMEAYLNGRYYAQGFGRRSGKGWKPVPELVDALGEMFLLSLREAQPTGARLVIGVDCSGSMEKHPGVGGISGFKPVDAAFLMAWITARTEPKATVVAFDDRVREIDDLRHVDSLQQLAAFARETMAMLGERTDCALPILHAERNLGDVDGFAIYTDEETWCGSVHPIEALGCYRRRWGRPRTKLVSVGLVATEYSLVNPETSRDVEDDAGTLAVVGFDSHAPAVIADFLRPS